MAKRQTRKRRRAATSVRTPVPVPWSEYIEKVYGDPVSGDLCSSGIRVLVAALRLEAKGLTPDQVFHAAMKFKRIADIATSHLNENELDFDGFEGELGSLRESLTRLKTDSPLISRGEEFLAMAKTEIERLKKLVRLPYRVGTKYVLIAAQSSEGSHV